MGLSEYAHCHMLAPPRTRITDSLFDVTGPQHLSSTVA